LKAIDGRQGRMPDGYGDALVIIRGFDAANIRAGKADHVAESAVINDDARRPYLIAHAMFRRIICLYFS
jgi:hypothetical protein